MEFDKKLRAQYEAARTRFAGRDQRMNMIRLVRNGRMSEVYPDMFPAGPPQREKKNYWQRYLNDFSRTYDLT